MRDHDNLLLKGRPLIMRLRQPNLQERFQLCVLTLGRRKTAVYSIGRMSMSVCRIAMAVLLALVGSCLSQEKSGVDQRAAVPEVQRILSIEGRSGSLEYWGFCDPDKDWPDFPEPRSVSNRKGSALDLLQWMFADDPKMQVTQERDGKIRMVEADVPQDLLQVKIHHISFSMPYTNGAIAHSGPMAVYALLNTPEVIAFMDQN